MKISKIVLWSMLVLAAVACGEDPDVEIAPPASEGRLTIELSSQSDLFDREECGVRFKARGGEILIDVVTNGDSWSYATSDGDWLEITADSYFLTLAAEANGAEERRTATLTITATDDAERTTIATLSITQAGTASSDISLSVAEHNFQAHTSLTTTVAVDSSREDWDVECTCSWLLVEKDGDNLILTADDNLAHVKRSTTITAVVGEGDDIAKDSITVTQDGSAFITLRSKNVATDDDGGRRTLTFDSNPELERAIVNVTDSWFSAVLEGDSVAITVEPNAQIRLTFLQSGADDTNIVVCGAEAGSLAHFQNLVQNGPGTDTPGCAGNGFTFFAVDVYKTDGVGCQLFGRRVDHLVDFSQKFCMHLNHLAPIIAQRKYLSISYSVKIHRKLLLQLQGKKYIISADRNMGGV